MTYTNRFWMCDRCDKVRPMEERSTPIEVYNGSGGVKLNMSVCAACLREINDEAARRGGLEVTR